jgi:hypothetical protein
MRRMRELLKKVLSKSSHKELPNDESKETSNFGSLI